MGLRYKLPDSPVYWWHEGCGFTIDEQILIRRFVRLKTLEALAERQKCSLSTIRRQMTLIFAKIGAKNRQAALDIFRSVNKPSHFVAGKGDY